MTDVRLKATQIALHIGAVSQIANPPTISLSAASSATNSPFPTMIVPPVAVIDVMWLASAARAPRLAWILAAVSEIANPPTILLSTAASADKHSSPDRNRTTRRRDRRDVAGVRRQRSQIGLDIGRRVRNREPANNLVERRCIGGKYSSPDRDRTARRRDRRNVASVRRQGRQIGLDIGRRVRNRKPANDLIERGCIGDKQLQSQP